MAESNEKLSVDKEYEVISKRVGDAWGASHDAIKLFVQLYTAILGGAIWLKHNESHSSNAYVWASDALVLSLVLLCGTMLWDNGRTWLQWRRRLDLITRNRAVVELPVQLTIWNHGMEIVSSIAMFLAFLLFVWVNPFN